MSLRLLFALCVFGVLCSVGSPQAGDNTFCTLQGYTEKSVRGNLRTSFDYEGGFCRCDCDGVPLPFECTITDPKKSTQ